VGVFAPQQKTATLEKEQLGASGALYSTLETPKFIATKKTLLVAEFAGAYCCILAFLGENWPTAPVCTYVVHTLYISKIRKIKPVVSILRCFWIVRDGSCVRRCGTASHWEKQKGASPEHPSALGN
jgi:hypothetical protein